MSFRQHPAALVADKDLRPPGLVDARVLQYVVVTSPSTVRMIDRLSTSYEIT
jgi:hypothetical protein